MEPRAERHLMALVRSGQGLRLGRLHPGPAGCRSTPPTSESGLALGQTPTTRACFASCLAWEILVPAMRRCPAAHGWSPASLPEPIGPALCHIEGIASKRPLDRHGLTHLPRYGSNVYYCYTVGIRHKSRR